MTIVLLELALGGALLYAGFKCVQFVPLLAGNERPGTHCTGSLLTIIGAYLTAKVGSGIVGKILAAAGGAAAGAAAKKAVGRIPGRTAPPVEPTPPEVPVIPEVPFASLTTGAAPSGSLVSYQAATAVPISAGAFQSMTGLAAPV